jgi:glycosyltransferase involved in cell wall biosynthesis
MENTCISIVIASKGRPDAVSETIDCLHRQTLKPHEIIIVVPSQGDLPTKQWGEKVKYIVGPHGLTTQRNKGIAAISNEIPYVGCFDDDFELKEDYLEQAVAFMNAIASIVAISGKVAANGSISREEATALLASYKSQGSSRGRFFSKGKHHILFGCNMIIRRSILNYEHFDENLPFYSYGEDYDLSIRLERYGLIGRFDGCVGVHLETPGGRVREELRGYSFVANNWYFLRKGVMHLPLVIAWTRFWSMCVGMNIVVSFCKLLQGNRSLDWKGRLKGHLLALRDIFLGRCHPGRIKEL